MSNEQLKHIFDNSTCLTKKQMKSYVTGSMTNEEAHAAEVHLNSCPLCNDAVDGLFAQQEAGFSAMQTLNADFLKDHFGNINPQVHLNTFTATNHAKHIDLHKKKAKVHHLWRTASIAAGLVLLAGMLWYYRMLHEDVNKQQIAQELPSVQREAGESEPPPIVMNEPIVAQADKRPATNDKAAIAKTKTVNITHDAGGVQHDDTTQLVTGVYESPSAVNEEKIIARSAPEKLPAKANAAKALTNTRASENREDIPVAIAPRSMGNSYNMDAATGVAEIEKAVKKETISIDRLDQAHKLYEAKRYNDALNIYLKEISSTKDNDYKDEARIGAAKCYLAAGDTTKAKVYLMTVYAGRGEHKREAKKMLKEIE